MDPKGLICLAVADGKGCISECHGASHEEFFRERLSAFEETMAQPYVQGRDLIEAGILPDSHFSDYLAFAHKLRLSGISKDQALRQTLGYIRSRQAE